MRKVAGVEVLIILACTCLGLTHCAGLPSRAAAAAEAPDRGCTSFCLDYADGQSCVFGANLDYAVSCGLIFVNKRNTIKAGWEAGTTGELAVWTSKYGSVTFNWCGYQMPYAGMNEAGLIISTMWLEETKQVPPDPRPPLNSTFWLQYLLDNYSTVDEVIASESKVRVIDGTDHYLLSDKLGNRAVIEFLDGKMVCYKGQNLPVKALTNDPYQESVQAWRGGKLHHNDFESLIRFGTAADLLKGFRPNSNTALIGDNRAMVYYAFYILAAAAHPLTCWSIVFDNRNLQVYLSTKLNSQMRQIDFAKLDFSGNTPAQMLDIHDPLAGDISHDFADYSHEACLKRMLFTIRYLSPRLSEWEVARLLGFFEQFPYVKNGIDPQEQEIALSRKAHDVNVHLK